MRQLKKLWLLALLSALALPTAAAGEEKKQPAGTVTLDLYLAGVGIGVGTGSGTLELEGKQYPFSVSTLSIGDLGVAALSAKGRVYEMKDPSDFAGTYVGFEAGAEFGEGSGAALLKNEKGVVMDLVAEGEGARVDFGPLGAKIRLGGDPRPLRMRR